jgi:hypothetical protein
MELEESTTQFKPVADRRKIIPPPLPVRLVAIDDVVAITPAGLEAKLDAFYVQMFQFEREPSEPLTYRADNFNLRFTIVESPPPRDDMRPIGIEVHSLQEAEEKLIARELEYTKQRGLVASEKSLLLLDPAGNWVALVEAKHIV